MITISRRNFIVGVATVAAVGPTIARAAEIEFPLESNACAELFINGQQSGPTLPCRLTAVARGGDIFFDLDRVLEFPCLQSGSGYVLFANPERNKIICKLARLDAYCATGCTVMVRPLT